MTGETEEETWRRRTKIGKTCSYHGVQDAARKRRQASQHPGALTGCLVKISETQVNKCVTIERWKKTKECLNWFTQFCVDVEPLPNCHLEYLKTDCPEGYFPHKEALSKRGFLVYVSRTYRAMVPYLKGMRLSIDSCRPDRDEDGWRTTNTCEPRLELKLESDKVPKFVKMVKRWKNDLRVLLSFVAKEFPPGPLS